MAKDLTNNEKKIDIKIFKDMKNRVNKYIEEGGKPIDERKIYLDYDTKAEYVLYYKYKNMLVRYNAYVAKYNKEPTSLQICVNAGPIDDKNVKVPIDTFLDMKARVDAFKGTLNDSTHVYLDMTTMYDYINYSTYKNMLKNYNTFVSTKKRQPNYVTTTTKSCDNMAKDLTNNEKKIDIKIFKDMKNRVNKYIEEGGKPIDERKIYLDYDTKAEYVLYYKYK
ncbi:MAG: hypothetical protein PHN69_05960, partial [Candidatus Pacebacteria bacterium]|nr:hypothetical protein [Candidatus Paceibacterota bacterium]